jgi:hypothetical protein
MRDKFVTFMPGRRGEWKGHETKANVRRVIRANGTQRLRVFAVGEEDGWVVYTEIPASQWATYFAEGEA